MFRVVAFLYALSIHLVLRLLLLFQSLLHSLFLLLLGLECGRIFTVSRIRCLPESGNAKAGAQNSEADSGGESFHEILGQQFLERFYPIKEMESSVTEVTTASALLPHLRSPIHPRILVF